MTEAATITLTSHAPFSQPIFDLGPSSPEQKQLPLVAGATSDLVPDLA